MSLLIDQLAKYLPKSAEARMQVKTTFFAGIENVELPVSSRNGVRFMDEYHVTTDRSRIVEIASPFASGLGTVEMSYLTNGSAKAMIYRVSVQQVNENNVGASLRDLLIEDMLVINFLQFNLWIFRDNAAYYDRAWIAARINADVILNCNVWETRNSCADGSFDSVSFATDEFRAARSSERIPLRYIHSSQTPTMLTHESLRFQRFQYFVSSGRSSADVAMKIAQYCSALEALVSTAQTELSHQVSERVASVLSPPGSERIKLFSLVKEAYGFRSKTVHGASFSAKDVERLRACAMQIDNVCRQLVFAYIDPATGFKAAIEGSEPVATKFFVNKTLGCANESE